MKTCPDLSVQSLVGSWWKEDDSGTVCTGRLVWAYMAVVESQPLRLIVEGRNDPTDHTRCKFRVEPLDASRAPVFPTLPVAGLPKANRGEEFLVTRAKRRPALVLGTGGKEVPVEYRRGFPKSQTAPSLILTPYYGSKPTSTRGGYNIEWVNRIRLCEYPQCMWDLLPIRGGSSSILRFDHTQAISGHYRAVQVTPFRLSDEAVRIVLEWYLWLLSGADAPPPGSVLGTIRDELIVLDE